MGNAGSVFLGRWTPESVGDYASGTNHVLPTYGYAKVIGGVGVDSFRKSMTVQKLTHAGLEALGPTVQTMARIEELEAHARAVAYRLNRLPSKLRDSTENPIENPTPEETGPGLDQAPV